MTENCNCKERTAELQKAVEEVVSREDVKYVIGYSEGSYASRTKPYLIHRSEEAGSAVWNPLCVNNLTVFLKHAEKLPVPRGQEPDTRKIGIVVKGCDARALNQLIQELTIKREDVVIIGMACNQCVDPVKFEHALVEKGLPLDTQYDISWSEGKIIAVNRNNQEQKLEMEAGGNLLDKCTRCEVPTPEDADVTIGAPISAHGEDSYADLKELEEMSQEEREKFWDGQFDKCIRCYACRNICPVCLCKTCVLDSLKPQWVERSTGFDNKKMYHLQRAYCMLGRCIDCAECERACPVNIPLTKLYREGIKMIDEQFNYLPGRNQTDKPIFTRYDLEEKGGTIW